METAAETNQVSDDGDMDAENLKKSMVVKLHKTKMRSGQYFGEVCCTSHRCVAWLHKTLQ